jgi:uncharacterized protein involved in oxidation of intracellular sulfur
MAGGSSMKLGIVIYSDDSETVWNALRVANFGISQGDEVEVFLLAKGVELENLDNAVFKVMEQAANFKKSGGRILACGTCLKLRKSEGTEMCPMSTMKDLYQLIKECDKVISF